VIGFLTVYLAIVTIALAACMVWHRRVQQVAGGIPAGYDVLAADLGHDAAMGARGSLLLRDDEWGLVGKVDLLLRSADGATVIPVEYKPAWAGYEAGAIRPGHLLQLATAMLLCEADRRVNHIPPEGWIRYLDAAGQLVPGGEVRVENTATLRERLIRVVQRMRRALGTRVELHREHRSPARCRQCRLRALCGEAA
jgi:CRISPR/Cas system-associated exonuclease Cas4 (RecB family)